MANTNCNRLSYYLSGQIDSDMAIVARIRWCVTMTIKLPYQALLYPYCRGINTQDGRESDHVPILRNYEPPSLCLIKT